MLQIVPSWVFVYLHIPICVLFACRKIFIMAVIREIPVLPQSNRNPGTVVITLKWCVIFFSRVTFCVAFRTKLCSAVVCCSVAAVALLSLSGCCFVMALLSLSCCCFVIVVWVLFCYHCLAVALLPLSGCCFVISWHFVRVFVCECMCQFPPVHVQSTITLFINLLHSSNWLMTGILYW